MLDDHGQQFGEDLREDAPGVAAARLIDVAVAFPQLKKELDLGGFCITCIRQKVVAHELERVCLTSIRAAHARRVQQSL